MIGLLSAAAGVALGVGAVAMSGPPALPQGDRAAIERVVREYILANPEIIPEAMEKLRGREVAKAVAANRAQIETPFAGAWEGARDPDVTIVQFFDYNCGYCRAALADVDRLLKEDAKLRVVYREFPVLGPGSEEAARVSLAAARAGKYPQFHRALYALGRADARSAAQAARATGVDVSTANDAAVQRELDANLSLARPLNLSGTPAWVIGDRVIAGAVGYDALKAAIAAARAR